MGQDHLRRRRDDWGRKRRDPFLTWLYADPRRGARLSAAITIGLILFWISVVFGILVYLAVLIL